MSQLNVFLFVHWSFARLKKTMKSAGAEGVHQTSCYTQSDRVQEHQKPLSTIRTNKFQVLWDSVHNSLDGWSKPMHFEYKLNSKVNSWWQSANDATVDWIINRRARIQVEPLIGLFEHIELSFKFVLTIDESQNSSVGEQVCSANFSKYTPR